MRLIFNVLYVSALALGLGLGLTWWAAHAQHPFGSLNLGQWSASPSIGTPAVDAYTLAAVARAGEFPLPVVDGIAFKAFTDTDGVPLSGACQYRVEGLLPSSPHWTLAVNDRNGFVISNPAGRFVFTSRQALRRPDGGIAIAVGSQVQPGDWLPVAPHEQFVLVLRLYGIAVGAIAERSATLSLPRITRERCL
jgi:hypothetical protein